MKIAAHLILSFAFLHLFHQCISNKHGDLKIYVYNFQLWKNISESSLRQRDKHEILENSLNNGAGPVLEFSQGLYHTDQYQLFNIIYNRVLQDARLTLNPAEATTFFIPYDFAADSAFYKACGKSNGICFDFRKCPLAPTVESLLKESIWFRRNGGKDHLLIVGMNYAMDHYIGKPKCKSLLSGTCRNCTKLAIDDYSYMYADDEGIIARGDHWHAIPFPSDFHWNKYVKTPFPWENRMRPLLASYTGSGQSYYGPARRLRGSIIWYCEKHPDNCIHQSYGLSGTRSSFKVSGHNPLQVSAKSIFCFQPIGDLMTRKGLFDSLLQGCIPVTFDALTASVMYTWHWEESFWKEISIELPFHPVAFRYSDPILVLQELYDKNMSVILMKQELIRSRVFELQYGIEGRYSNKEERIIHDSWPRYEDGKGSPMRDAYEISLDHVLGWHSKRELDYRNATVPECWGGDAWLDTVANKCRKGKAKAR